MSFGFISAFFLDGRVPFHYLRRLNLADTVLNSGLVPQTALILLAGLHLVFDEIGQSLDLLKGRAIHVDDGVGIDLVRCLYAARHRRGRQDVGIGVLALGRVDEDALVS